MNTQRNHTKDTKTLSVWDFISIVSHQLRNPLASTKLSVEMLLGESLGPLTTEQREYLKMLLEDNQRMIRVVKEFLMISAVERGEIQITFDAVNLATATEDAIKELVPFASAHNVAVSFVKSASEFPLVYTDPLKIREVISNIIDNAIKYNRGQGRVEITIKRDGQKMKWQCRDTGIGIPEAEAYLIFTKFYRGSNATRIHPEGMGVGLYVSKAVVEKSGGEMGFESDEGKGSMFWFTLPIKK